MVRHSRVPCICCCRGRKAILTGWEYLHFKGERRRQYWKTNMLSTVLLWNSVKFSCMWLVMSMIYKARDINFWLICMCILYCVTWYTNSDTSPPGVAPPLLSTHESLWTEVYYFRVLFTTTPELLPQIVVNKQLHYIEVWLYSFSFVEGFWITLLTHINKIIHISVGPLVLSLCVQCRLKLFYTHYTENRTFFKQRM